MGKRSKKSAAKPALVHPIAPWIYVNDPKLGQPYADTLKTMLPAVETYEIGDKTADEAISRILAAELMDKVVLIHGSHEDSSDNITRSNLFKAAAIKRGCNYASVNLYVDEADAIVSNDLSKWGSNHLELQAGQDVRATAKKIFQWLFTVFTAHETIHLIDAAELKAVDNKNFADYEYCTIAETKNRPKDSKIQFVAIVLTRPVVGTDQRLTWTVADKTGVANFHFQYRGVSSQYTWDWVLALQPGDRKALPRMPMVEIKERKRTRLAKAPFRGIGLAVSSVGYTVRAIGHGVAKIGDAAKMGKSSKWVPEADVVDGKVVNWKKVFAEEEARYKNAASQSNTTSSYRAVKTFNEKGEKAWMDDDDDASTEADDASTEADDASVVLREKEFC